MRKIAQKGAKTPQRSMDKAKAAEKAKMTKQYKTGGVKKAQKGEGIKNFDFSETNRYTYPGFASRMMSGAYEAQPFVRAKRAEEKSRAALTPDQREAKDITARRVAAGKAGPQYMQGKPANKQKKGGVTKKTVAKPKAKYGAAKKSSSKRSK
jgi:hypothetical protein